MHWEVLGDARHPWQSRRLSRNSGKRLHATLTVLTTALAVAGANMERALLQTTSSFQTLPDGVLGGYTTGSTQLQIYNTFNADLDGGVTQGSMIFNKTDYSLVTSPYYELPFSAQLSQYTFLLPTVINAACATLNVTNSTDGIYTFVQNTQAVSPPGTLQDGSGATVATSGQPSSVVGNSLVRNTQFMAIPLVTSSYNTMLVWNNNSSPQFVLIKGGYRPAGVGCATNTTSRRQNSVLLTALGTGSPPFHTYPMTIGNATCARIALTANEDGTSSSPVRVTLNRTSVANRLAINAVQPAQASVLWHVDVTSGNSASFIYTDVSLDPNQYYQYVASTASLDGSPVSNAVTVRIWVALLPANATSQSGSTDCGQIIPDSTFTAVNGALAPATAPSAPVPSTIITLSGAPRPSSASPQPPVAAPPQGAIPDADAIAGSSSNQIQTPIMG